MHISEGVLSFPVLAGSGALAAAGTAVGLKKLDYDHIITAALLSSAFFVASLIHVPLGPGSVHLVLNGLLGIILGWASIPAIAVALFLQALLFGHGGLSALGANTIIMAGPALTVYFLFNRWIQKAGKKQAIGAFLAGSLGVALSVLLAAASLLSTDQDFLRTAQLLLISQLPIMVIEGILTLFTVSFLNRVQPAILHPVTN